MEKSFRGIEHDEWVIDALDNTKFLLLQCKMTCLVLGQRIRYWSAIEDSLNYLTSTRILDTSVEGTVVGVTVKMIGNGRKWRKSWALMKTNWENGNWNCGDQQRELMATLPKMDFYLVVFYSELCVGEWVEREKRVERMKNPKV